MDQEHGNSTATTEVQEDKQEGTVGKRDERPSEVSSGSPNKQDEHAQK